MTETFEPVQLDNQCICGSNHISSDPRRFSAAVYSGQFVVRYRYGRLGHHAHLCGERRCFNMTR